MRFLVLIFFLSCTPAFGWEGIVLYVHDGDTIRVARDGVAAPVKIRLWGIDAPESGQEFGAKSRDILDAMLHEGAKISVEEKGVDRYDRTLAILTNPDGKVAQEEMLKAGACWVYVKYCPDCRDWYGLETKARTSRRGLWQSANPLPPWEWRKQQKER